MPYALSRSLIRRVNEVNGRPAVFYFHPWDSIRIARRTRPGPARHYVDLHRTEPRLSLLRDSSWRRVDHVFLEALP